MKTSQFKGELREVAVADIKPYFRNVRDNNPKAVAVVKDSIERYGYQNPIVVDSEMTVIAGHTRLKAIKELGWEKVKVIVSDLPADKAREFRIVDNRTSEFSGWVEDKLALEVREFADLDYAKEMFPEMTSSVETVNPGEYDVDEKDVERAKQKLATQFTDKASARNDAGKFIDIPCPHCSHKFGMTVKDVYAKFKYDKESRELGL